MSDMASIDSHGTPIKVEIYPPPATSNGAAVVVTHGSDGMKEPWAAMIRAYASDLADRGYTALIPYYFEKTGTTPGQQAWTAGPAGLHAWIEAISDTTVFSRTILKPPASRVGLLGF